ncbi:hypothetical protein H0H92_011681 [Tricholoma furcatifolium]|nr:hypothetical protein H0H92_011681 [Tricholoma furcatifolium]
MQAQAPNVNEFVQTHYIVISGGLPTFQNLTGVDITINDNIVLKAGEERKLSYLCTIKYKDVPYCLTQDYKVNTEKLISGLMVIQKPPFDDKWFKVTWNSTEVSDTVAKLEPKPEPKPIPPQKKGGFLFTKEPTGM